jgi:hypothetical protein
MEKARNASEPSDTHLQVPLCGTCRARRAGEEFFQFFVAFWLAMHQ